MNLYRKHTADDDSELVTAWRSGDVPSFEKLVRKYQDCLFNIAFRITGSYEDACAVLRDVWASAYRVGASLPGPVRCGEWLTALAVVECRNRLEALPGAKGSAAQAGGGAAERPHVPEPGFAPERPTLHDRLHACIGLLPVDLREVIVLRDVQGFSYDDLSAILKISSGTVMNRVVRAREMVRDCLKQGGRIVAVHEDIRHKFSAYLENTLRPDEKEEIKRHLGSCGLCREEFANLEWTVGHLRSLPPVEIPPWFPARVLEEMQTPPPGAVAQPGLDGRFFSPVRTKLQIGAVVLVAFVVLAYSFLRQSGFQSPPAAPPEEVSLPAAVRPAQPTGSAAMPDLPEPSGAPRRTAGLPPAGQQQRLEVANHASSLQPAAPALPARQPEEPQLQPADEDSEPVVEAVQSRAREKKPAPVLAQQREKRGADRAAYSGELDIVLRVDDPAVAAGAIERAVSRIGGRVTGRAHSGGDDLLYTQIDGRNFPELIDRLGRIGKIHERPQTPDSSGGMVDLVIRW